MNGPNIGPFEIVGMVVGVAFLVAVAIVLIMLIKKREG
jgi:hypothetical protein